MNSGFNQQTPFSSLGSFGAIQPPAPGAPVLPPNLLGMNLGGGMPSSELDSNTLSELFSTFGNINFGGGVGGGKKEDSNWFQDIGGLAGLGSIAQGLASLGQAYSAMQGVGLAKDQMKFTRQAFEKNLQNAERSYNTSLEDRIRSRYHTEGRDDSAVQSYLNKHSL